MPNKSEYEKRLRREKRNKQLVYTMIFVVIATLVLPMSYLFFSSVDSFEKRLLEEVYDIKNLVEAVGRFDSKNSQNDHQGGNVAATLSQVVDAFSGERQTGQTEFVIAEKRGNRMYFITTSKNYGFPEKNVSPSIYQLSKVERWLPIGADKAVPMQLALSGKSGNVFDRDYRGVDVLAAYAPVTIDGKQFGIVSKVDASEIWGSLVSATLFAILLAVVAISFGAWRFLRLVNPLITALEEENTNNQAMVRTSPSGIVILDSQGKILRFNPAAEKMFGYSEQEMLGQLVTKLIATDVAKSQLQLFKDIIARPAEHAGGVNIEVTARAKNGDLLPVYLAIGVVNLTNDVHLVGMISDLSAQKQSEQELMAHREHLERLVTEATAEVNAIVDTAVSGIITINEHGIIDVFNPAAETLFGWKREEVIGKNVSMLMEQHIGHQHDGYLSNYLETGDAKIIGIGREIECKRRDGSTFPAHLSVGHAELGEKNHFFVGFVTDISELKKRENELRQAKEAAEIGAQTKSAFMANMSHEIRTPMNAIIGFIELILENDKLDKDDQKYAKTIENASKSLLSILNDILDVSKLESGKLGLESICFNLRLALQNTLDTVAYRAAEKSLSLEFQFSGDLHERVMGDPTRLRQVVLNLLGNAVKFTEHGKVELIARPGRELDEIHFTVRDTGIGMTQEQVKTIFDPFVQADDSISRSYGGTGLGTTISKQIVEMMGGEIWVESEEGKGAAFHFCVSLPKTEQEGPCVYEESEKLVNPVSGRSYRILLAEDVEANAALVIHRMRSIGHEIHWVKNGVEAVAEIKKGDFDIVLMDVMMPEMDGITATTKIRQLEQGADKRVPIVALTAGVLKEEKQRCLDAGMDLIEGKPIDFDSLRISMESVVPQDAGRELSSTQQVLISESQVDFSPVANIVDYEKALTNWSDPRMLIKYLHKFVDHYHDFMPPLRAMLYEEGQTESAIHAAHKLKGAAGNLGILSVMRFAQNVESALKQNRMDKVAAAADELEVALDQAVVGISRLSRERVDGEEVRLDTDKAMESLLGLLGVLPLQDPAACNPWLQQLAECLPRNEWVGIADQIDDFEFDQAAEIATGLMQNLEH